MPKKWEGGYIRGGRNTLYMTRRDIVETLKVVGLGCGVGELGNLLSEAMVEIELESNQLRWPDNEEEGNT